MRAFDRPIPGGDGIWFFVGVPPCAAVRDALMNSAARHGATYYIQFDYPRSKKQAPILVKHRGKVGQIFGYVGRAFGGRSEEVLLWTLLGANGKTPTPEFVEVLLGRPVCGGSGTPMKNRITADPTSPVCRSLLRKGTIEEASRMTSLVNDEVKLQRLTIESLEKKIASVDSELREAKRMRWVEPDPAERTLWDQKFVDVRKHLSRRRNEHLAAVEHVDRERRKMLRLLEHLRDMKAAEECLRAAKWGLGF